MKYISLISVISLLTFSCQESTAPMPEDEIEGEFLVNTMTEGDQTDPKIAALDDGNFVVVWSSKIDDQYYFIKGQLFNHEGLKTGNEFYITTGSSESPYQFIVLSTPTGFYVQWWEKYTYLNTYLYSLSFDANAYRMGNIVQFDTGKNIDYRYVDTSLLTDNKIITVFCGVNVGLFYIIWDQTGRTVIQQGIIVPESAEGYPIFTRACGLEEGSFVIVWTYQEMAPTSEYFMHLMQQIIDEDGTPQGDPLIIFSYPPELLYPRVLPIDLGYNSGYTVLWTSGFTGCLMGQYFNQSGEYMSEQTLLEDVSEDYQVFKTDKNYFGIVDFGADVIFNEYKVDPHSISKNETFILNQLNESSLYPGNGAKIHDNKIAVVWYGEYNEDYDIYGKILEY